jgi:hypothetical protein
MASASCRERIEISPVKEGNIFGSDPMVRRVKQHVPPSAGLRLHRRVCVFIRDDACRTTIYTGDHSRFSIMTSRRRATRTLLMKLPLEITCGKGNDKIMAINAKSSSSKHHSSSNSSSPSTNASAGGERKRKPHSKKRTGCLTCKRRHTRCDEGAPVW